MFTVISWHGYIQKVFSVFTSLVSSIFTHEIQSKDLVRILEASSISNIKFDLTVGQIRGREGVGIEGYPLVNEIHEISE